MQLKELNNFNVILPPGRKIMLDELTTDDIDIEHIIRSLRRQARYNGLTQHFYSVAAHSINVAYALWQATKSLRLTTLGLMHDFSETYVGDLVASFKMDEQREIENHIMFLIHGAFDIVLPNEHEDYFVDCFDKMMWRTECDFLYENSLALPRLSFHLYLDDENDTERTGEDLKNLWTDLVNGSEPIFPKGVGLEKLSEMPEALQAEESF